MLGSLALPYRRSCLRAFAGGFLIALAAACSADGLGPSADALPGDPTAIPADSTAIPADSTVVPGDTTVSIPGDSVSVPPSDSTLPPPDSTVPPPADSNATTDDKISTSSHPGIAFGTFNLEGPHLGAVHTGSLRAGTIPTSFLPVLLEAQGKKARLVIKLTGGSASHVKNSDGTFSFTKWKALVDKYKSVTASFAPYIADGTIIGHYLIDEPNMAHRWGGQQVPQATIEAMAKYSKEIFPSMPTLVRVVPTWLASAPVTYTHLDAGWAQYTSVKGDAAQWIAAEVSAARSRGLGLVVSLNVLNGGNGSSGIRGTESGRYSMSASELRSYGTALLNQTYTCAFYQWMYNSTYFGRSDVESAMADLSAKASARVKTSCSQ
ncbi:MAG TPA: hypothetical protein VFS51_12430 [Gemmatimonadales bacterium]|nr:hypothetical protein [Gemmatimonadales bacterium]